MAARKPQLGCGSVSP